MLKSVNFYNGQRTIVKTLEQLDSFVRYHELLRPGEALNFYMAECSSFNPLILEEGQNEYCPIQLTDDNEANPPSTTQELSTRNQPNEPSQRSDARYRTPENPPRPDPHAALLSRVELPVILCRV